MSAGSMVGGGGTGVVGVVFGGDGGAGATVGFNFRRGVYLQTDLVLSLYFSRMTQGILRVTRVFYGIQTSS